MKIKGGFVLKEFLVFIILALCSLNVFEVSASSNRVIIDETREMPYSPVCKIEVRYSTTASTGEPAIAVQRGSGFLISNNTVATAANNFDDSIGELLSIKLIFPSGSFNVIEYYIPADYNIHGAYSSENDYAFISVPSYQVSGSGYYGIVASNNLAAYNRKNTFVIGVIGNNMYEGAGMISSTNFANSQIYYNADTDGGQSGGPARTLYSSSYKYQAYGIHCGALTTTGPNRARIFDLDLFDWLNSKNMI